MDFLDAPIFDGLFSPSVSQFTDTLSQLPFIPTTQTPNTSFVRSSHWPSPGSSSPLLAYPSPTNTVQDFPVHRGPRTAQVSFQRPYPYSLSPSPHNVPPAVTYQHYEAVVPHVVPVHIDDFLNLVKNMKRPPRPANAFMLFRSDFLKRKFISKDQETRQHRLSIIAAKCWHRLSKAEKQKWFSEAERAKKTHALQYAGYKFQPRARMTRRKSRREPKPARSPPPEDFDRLADLAYREMINNDDLTHENAKLRSHGLGRSPSTTSASPTPPLTPQIDTTELPGYGEQVVQRSLSSPAAAAMRRDAQLPYDRVAATEDTGTTTMSRGIRRLSSSGDHGIQVASNDLPGTAGHPLCSGCTFSSRVMPQALAQAHSNSHLFTVFDSSARLPRGVLRVPLPASLAQNPSANT